MKPKNLTPCKIFTIIIFNVQVSKLRTHKLCVSEQSTVSDVPVCNYMSTTRVVDIWLQTGTQKNQEHVPDFSVWR